MFRTMLLSASLLAGTWAAHGEEPLRVLFLSKSSGFEHSAIKHADGEPSHVDLALQELVGDLGGELLYTKDASLINADNLKNFDVVVFFTTGDLTTPGNDGEPPMGPDGVSELLAWIEGGGGFLGFHSATDTFHPDPQCSSPTPFIEMIGGEFQSHGPQFEGTIRVTDPEHPVMAAVEDGWVINDEWYIFCNLDEENMRVLALLDTSEPPARRIRMYRRPSYPIIWAKGLGEGRIFYNAMGHREDVWDHEHFRQHVKDALVWAGGEGEARVEPNYKDVVPNGDEDKEDDDA